MKAKRVRLRLTLHDRNSPLWAEIAAEVEVELAVLRARLEKRIDEKDTEFTRGSIAALKRVLAFASEEPADLSDDDTPA